jgi:hypothetical protein
VAPGAGPRRLEQRFALGGRGARSRAVALIDRTDASISGDALSDLGEVLAGAGRTDEAVSVFGQALERYELKRNLAAAGHVRSRIETLSKGRSSAVQ